MESVGGAAPRFFAGEPTRVKDVTAYNSGTTVLGSYDANTGTITIHLPFSVIGDHSKAGTTFYSATAFTATTVGELGGIPGGPGPSSSGNPVGIFNQVDATTPFDYVLGSPSLKTATAPNNSSPTSSPEAGNAGGTRGSSSGSSGSVAPASGSATAAGTAGRASSGGLGFTGLDALFLGLIAILLLEGGAVLVLVSRRKGVSVWEATRIGRGRS
jgi:hypothetical protein